MEPMYHKEKASPAIQSNPPTQEPKKSAFAQSWNSSTSDKLWHLTQVPALLSCVLLVIGSSCAYFMSDYVNCDGYNPYSQALMSGMYAMLLCMNSYLYAHHLREAGKELDSPNTLSPQARQTRRRRIPVLLSALAVGQYIAAVASGLAAHRTSRAPLNVGFVSVAAFIGMISCTAAGTYDICLAVSIQRPSWKDAHGSIDDKDIEVKQSTSLYDMDFTRLPTFGKHWLAVHAIALAMFFSAAATSASLLWQTSCEDSNRKPLMKLSEAPFAHFPNILNMLLVMVKMWLQHVNGAAVSAKGLSRFMYIMVQLYFATAGLGLGLSAYEAPNSSYGLVLVKLQMAAAAAAFFVCAGYDFALMLKTNFNAPPQNDADTLEKDVGKESGLSSQ
ncbi:hypothetical protein MBLNU13_g09012t1 [Cladosporium sp. NU13]